MGLLFRLLRPLKNRFLGIIPLIKTSNPILVLRTRSIEKLPVFISFCENIAVMIMVSACSCVKTLIFPGFYNGFSSSSRINMIPTRKFSRVCSIRASVVDSSESSSDFVKRMEKAWLISEVLNYLVIPTLGELRCCPQRRFWFLGVGLYGLRLLES
ncbi:uncharacterized protein LOC18435300 isoform X2 [Amborella trichopoda]|uniref:uncharacterized protein LOC18435300 isoform X2 n=1 Tax=Amborella trichopoda TaxID=13333 RepID=UPI0009C01824|nr:uncharacterized protein LOC18435300 isoform X2 [Amborella trichopoda]|eukprot:XP_020523637.1 uncharacterized protein LOC18435300 isoform X2 [Amborella trichopoda]